MQITICNGKALTNGDNTNIALKTINGKKYAFDEEGKMLYGWVAEDNAERIDNTDGDGFKEAKAVWLYRRFHLQYPAAEYVELCSCRDADDAPHCWVRAGDYCRGVSGISVCRGLSAWCIPGT